MSDSDKTPNLSTHQNRNCQKSFSSFPLQILAVLGVDARIGLNGFADHGACRKKEFLICWVLFPRHRLLHEWTLRIRRGLLSAVCAEAQDMVLSRFVV